MHFYQRAYLSIMRQKTKTIVLFIVLFLMANVIAGAIAIKSAANQVAEDIKTKLGTAISIQPFVQTATYGNMTWTYVDMENTEIPQAIVDTIMARPEVEVFDTGRLLNMVYYNGTNRNLLVFTSSSEGLGNGFSDTFWSDTLEARSVLNPKFFDLESQRISIVDGRNITQEEFDEGKNVGLIPAPLANRSMFKVGDILSFRFQDYERTHHEHSQDIGESYEIEIVGIFDLNSESYFNPSGQGIKEELFYVYVPDKFMDKLEAMAIDFEESYPEAHSSGRYTMDYYSSGAGSSVYFPKMLLNSADDLEPFKAYLQDLLGDLNLNVITANDSYESIVAPIHIISVIANYILIIAFGVTILTVTLITILFLRDRTHELGIYAAIGKTKLNSVSQVLLEVFAIAVLATTISVFTGHLLSNKLTTSIVQKQLSMVDEAKLVKIDQSASTLVSAQDVSNSYQTKLDADYLISLYGTVLGSAILSAIIPSILILSVKPKKILL